MNRIMQVIAAAGLMFAQTAAPPAFEVASIRASVPPVFTIPLRTTPDRLTGTGISPDYLIQWAYGIRDFQLTGGPEWIKSARFDLEAKADSAVGESEMKLMVQTLLAERFHLQFHRDTKEFSGYALTVAKNGPKLPAAKANADRGNIQIGNGVMYGRAASTSVLAQALTVLVDRPVFFDRTGLDGKYDFKLEYDPSTVHRETVAPESNAAAPAPSASGSIFTALQEQLGLRLDSFKGPLEILVIDRVEKPTEN